MTNPTSDASVSGRPVGAAGSAFAGVIFDVGGVLTDSPFAAFARFEAERGLPDGFLRRVNAADHHTNAWARLERGEIDAATFGRAFAAESAALGHAVDGREVLALLQPATRPRMLAAVRVCRDAGLRTGLLTNNWHPPEPVAEGADAGLGGFTPDGFGALSAVVDVVIESRLLGLRKPEPAVYPYACERLGVAPAQVVFLDDLGVNLKPAAALGMTTIKVVSEEQALADLSAVLGFDLVAAIG